MARVAVKKTPTVVTITAPWQVAFMVAVVLSQLAWMVVLLWSYTQHGAYVSFGTWLWQVSVWLYPLLYVGAGYWYVRRRVQGKMPRLFWAVFLATIAYGFYMAEGALSNWLRFNIIHFLPPHGNGVWAAFGWDWLQMGVLFALFCLVLGVLANRKRA